MTRPFVRRYVIFAAIFAAVVGAYLPALRGGFVWDDAAHVTRPDLRSLHGLERIWFEVGATQQYYPVVFTAFWVEHRLWGDDVLGYHLLNVLLHATAACLVVVLARRLRIPGAEVAGLLFALHPVNVESVAWISEQKNTLSAVFYLSAALAWLVWRNAGTDEAKTERPTPTGATRPGLYWLATALFLLALFTKTVTATLPAALLVIAWWQRGRLSWRRDVRPLLPWFAAAIAAGVLTSVVEHRMMAVTSVTVGLTFLQRCLVAGRAIVFYFTKLCWPADLIFIYPRWTVDPRVAWQWLFPAGVLAVPAVLVWRCAASRGEKRGLLAGFLLFAGTLVPALGFISAYPFRYSFVADHFQYLACLGLVVPAAAGWAAFGHQPKRSIKPGRAIGWAVTGAILGLLGVLTWHQCGMYRDLATLYRTTIARNPGCWMARTNLGTLLVEAGRPAEAIPLLEQSVREDPTVVETYGELGNALAAVGRTEEAIAAYTHGLRLDPRRPQLEHGLGCVLDQAGRMTEAMAHYQRALQLDPGYGPAHANLAVDLSRLGRFAEAVGHYRAALQHEAGTSALHNACGIALLQTGQMADAIRQFEAAIRLAPDQGDLHYNLAIALSRMGRTQEAQAELARALQLDPRLQAPSP